MPLKTQIAPLSKAMDSDSGDKYINTSDGWVRNRVNLRTNELGGNSLFNKQLKGNVLVDIAMPSGTNKCISSCPDIKTESLIWFVYNSEGNHSILRVYVKTDVIEKIWYSQAGLGLIDDTLNAEVVDGRLYWVNGTEKPKSFNIEKAVNYTAGETENAYVIESGLEEATLKDEILPWIKRPPQFAPEVEYVSVTEEAGLPVNFNNLRGKLFQFKYSFVYEDDQESAYSEISKVPLPQGDLTTTGNWSEDFSKNNAISLKINTGNSIVKQINVAARISSEYNSGDFFLFKIIHKWENDTQVIDDNAEYEVIYLNNGNIRSVNTEINNRYCDDVPLFADDMEFLDGKYLSLSMPTKNYDQVVADMALTHSFESASFGVSLTPMGVQLISSTRTLSSYKVTLPSTAVLNSEYRVTVTFWSGDIISKSYTMGRVDPGAELVRNYVYNDLKADSRLTSSPNFTSSGTDSILYTTFRDITSGGPNSIRYVSSVIESGAVPSIKSFKKGQFHRIGIVYNDGFGRYNVVNNAVTIFVPYPQLKTDYNKVSRISFQINHRPPIWSTSYRFVYAPYISYTYMLDVIDVEFNASGDNIPSSHTFVKINQAIEAYRNKNEKMIIPDYVWRKGDRCKVFYQVGHTGDLDNSSYEISGTFTREYTDSETPATEDGFIVDGILTDAYGLEIFRPNFELSGNIFYETGDSFEILNAGTESRSHSAKRLDIENNGVDQSDDLATPASGYLTFGDVYMRNRYSTSTLVVEDMGYSDFYKSNSIDVGRVTAIIESRSKQKSLHRVVKGENFLEDTEYNLLNVFLPQSEYFQASQSYGRITGIKNVGEVLKVIQPSKETSIYIGKAYVKQSDGSNITVISDKVFNLGNENISEFGTRYPRSIAVFGRNIYYFDDKTGDLVRSAANGQESISNFYNFRSYFKAKSDQLKASSDFTDVIISANSDYEEILIIFIDGSDCETIAFSEKEGLKGFTYKAEIKPASGVPDNFGWYGNNLFSFLSGKPYRHNTGALNEFFGDRKDFSISFVVNTEASNANKYSDIEFSSSENIWDIQFDIVDGVNYPVQKSILKPGIIREKENRMYSSILKNILGRNGVQDLQKLRNGQQMTGETMLVTFSGSTTNDVTLKEVEVKFLTAK